MDELTRSVIAASPELREREQHKMMELVQAVSRGLVRRGLSEADAELIAGVGLAVFGAAWNRWVQLYGAGSFSEIFESMVETVRTLPGLATSGTRVRVEPGD